ncbi:type I restriction enzyme, S subunit [Vibrio crassostreae]|uniref:restriction endonuclease subunit S n=1 Tax=Vibrio crassostreae TaxID=246167 RepID=UPI0006378894|nr:restriction endonuclease subunit S [Vibrio crassostreae]CAK1704226.1 type I restriction enzyme, S subunit [Vibrio crassostreae]CAK1710582.1 type I restriction enzyme, S subunit [Vibrio crassostreae]CAK1996189.1 type I restriction enzyme, S subunit [Vibrio crassostreae]CAK2004788.1 type I restriction enzyme, S subunit [Vibrio crassostreae]CAK2006505.1 type I restriction enzyme, S subunit [Vibrio crassostreae]
MTWKMESISDLCIFAIDCVNKTAPVVDYETPYKMIRTTNVKGGFIDLDTVRYVEEETFIKWTRRSKPQYGDVIFTREAPVGDVGRFTSKDPNVFLGQRLFHYRPNSELLDWRYLAYVLQSEAIQGWVHGIAFGATVPHIKVADAENLQIPCPPISIQRKIGTVLSAYDDLIENNLERIKLLEEMAQITYEQWFVRMKFPGHEEVEIDSETGLPDDWEEQDLSKYISIKHGFAYKGEFFSEGETNQVLLTPGNFKIGGGIKLDKVKYYDEDAESPEGYVLNQHDLLVTMTDLSKMADTLGFPLLVPSSKTKIFLHNQRLGKVLPVGDSNFPKYFYYMLFQDERYRAFVVGSATGATVKHSSPSKILAYKPQLPPLDGELIFKFNDVTKPIFETIDLLMKESELLREARDILLPRLMTGMIDIEKVELPEALLDRINKENNNEINIG